ncbi:MAG TPA: DUF3459 domain-containing protein, partial [Acidimicrobiia bacterium]|nr:DUF3459 domain-containing protein [Acidimicrobiia bacterium]
ADETSILHLYRRLLHLRRGSTALRTGRLALREAPDPVVAYDRSDGTECWTVAVNFADEPVVCDVAGTVAVASDGRGEGTAFAGALAPRQAVVVRR